MANQVYSYVTEAIVKALEAGTVPWQKPWKDSLGPCNFKTKRPYNGINYFLTICSEYTSPYWMTKLQMQELGGTLKSGVQHYTMVVFFNMLEFDDAKSKTGTRKFPYLRYYKVYNLEQVDGLTAPPAEVVTFDPIKRAEDLILYMPQRPTISYDSNSAYYKPHQDEVHSPKRENYKSNVAFYSTMFHELGHSTGHESRLKRFDSAVSASMFEPNSYSKEELVAEMTAAFLCAHCGINQTILNSSAYIQSWIKTLKGDTKLIVQASSAAQKAANFIINKKEEVAE